MKQAKIFSLIMVAEIGQYLVTLEEVDGTRLIPIWVGPGEGMSIAAGLQHDSFPRPLTHDLIKNILAELKVEVERVVVTDLRDDTFYANICLVSGQDKFNIDARPSDSIALAVRSDLPIYIEERVFKKCPDIHKPITEQEADTFKESLKNLRPEDFFREKRQEEKDG